QSARSRQRHGGIAARGRARERGRRQGRGATSQRRLRAMDFDAAAACDAKERADTRRTGRGEARRDNGDFEPAVASVGATVTARSGRGVDGRWHGNGGRSVAYGPDGRAAPTQTVAGCRGFKAADSAEIESREVGGWRCTGGDDAAANFDEGAGASARGR